MTEHLADAARTPDTLPLDAPAPPQVLGASKTELAPAAEPQPEPQSPPAALEVQFVPPPGEPARSSLTLELRCDAPGAVIRYALGNAPELDVDEDDFLYDPSEPILLTLSTFVLARAWLHGEPGPQSSASYEVIKALWEIREPEDQSDATPHQESRGFAFDDGWQAAAASARGKLHAHRGLWREDAFDIAQAASPSGTWAILAVADGAGSASLARVGSRLACGAATESLRSSLAEQELSADASLLKERDLPLLRDKMVGAARTALQVLEREAQEREKPLGDFATTLLLLVRCAWAGQQVCGSLQVGDGAIALLNQDGLMTILGVADHGEHSSETRFLSTPGIESELAARTRFSIRSGLGAVAVMSDGVSDDFFPEEQRLPALLAQVLPLARQSEPQGEPDHAALLGWLGYEKKGSSDDRTLIVSWSGEGAASTCSAEAQGSRQEAESEAVATSQSESQEPGLDGFDKAGAVTGAPGDAASTCSGQVGQVGAESQATSEISGEGGGEDAASHGAA